MMTDNALAKFGIQWIVNGGDTRQEKGGTHEFLASCFHSLYL